MLVLLKNNWLGPNGHLYRKDAEGTEIPDRYEKELPKAAKVLAKEGKSALTEEDRAALAFASDAAAVKAAEARLAPSEIQGTGTDNKITVKDVDKAIAKLKGQEGSDGKEGVLPKNAGQDRQAQEAMDNILKNKKA